MSVFSRIILLVGVFLSDDRFGVADPEAAGEEAISPHTIKVNCYEGVQVFSLELMTFFRNLLFFLKML